MTMETKEASHGTTQAPVIPDALLDQLLAGADAKTAFDKDGLVDELKKALAERALNAEMDYHLETGEDDGNRRNGYGKKTVLTGTGKMANEVAMLLLNDLDRRFGQLLVNGKGRQRTPMPLPPDVGAAIADCLRDCSPRSDSRRLLLREDAPHAGFASSSSIFMVANTALRRAGIQGHAHVGAHLFRHNLTTEQLRSGACLIEIGQLLRHRDYYTTRLYENDHPMCRQIPQSQAGSTALLQNQAHRLHRDRLGNHAETDAVRDPCASGRAATVRAGHQPTRLSTAR